MRSLSGLQATGSIHLGNYIGAVSIWAETQKHYTDSFYFVPDLHTLNIRPEPQQLQEGVYQAVAFLLASGVDPTKSAIFAQSTISAHSELFNILNNYVTMGELSRMTQFKDKQKKFGGEGAVVGLFEYPVLMAADILLYDIDAVPVGKDQKQHVELARDIASRFNKIYGDTFKLPKVVISQAGGRIMNLQDPTKKMSKSDNDSSGCIFLSDTPQDIKKKIIRAVTDSDDRIIVDKDKPGVSNLLTIYSLLTTTSIADLEKGYKDKSYGEFKADLAEAVINVLNPIQQKYAQLMGNKPQILQILAQGRAKAEPLAQAKLDEVKQKIGLLTP